MTITERHTGFRILDHPADMGIEASGSNLKEAFEQAAAALTSIILDPSGIEKRETRTVELISSDYEHLLVNWLAEVLYLYDGDGFVGKRFEIWDLSSESLKARIEGEKFNPEKHVTKLDVKAVTYHQIHVEKNETGGQVRVFLDI